MTFCRFAVLDYSSIWACLPKGLTRQNVMSYKRGDKGIASMKVYKDIPRVHYWYDRAYALWWAARVDENGDTHYNGQFIELSNAWTKKDIKDIARFMSDTKKPKGN